MPKSVPGEGFGWHGSGTVRQYLAPRGEAYDRKYEEKLRKDDK